MHSAMQDLTATRPAAATLIAVRLGMLRVRQGKVAEARALYESALPMPGAILALGELDLADGDATAAADAAERVLRRLGDASVLDRLPALELLARAGLSRAMPMERAPPRIVLTRTLRASRRPTCGDAAGYCKLMSSSRPASRTWRGNRRGRDRPLRHVLGAIRSRSGAAGSVRRTRALGRADRAESEANAARDAFTTLGAQGELRRAGADRSARARSDILRLVATGMSDPEIADRLFLSRHTVHRHIANIRTKLGVPSRAAAVAYATRNQLF